MQYYYSHNNLTIYYSLVSFIPPFPAEIAINAFKRLSHAFVVVNGIVYPLTHANA